MALAELRERQRRQEDDARRQLALIEERQREPVARPVPPPVPPVAAAPPAAAAPTSPPVSTAGRLRQSMELLRDRYDALMNSNVNVGDTALNVGGLKDTLVSLTTTVLAEINPSTFFRALGKGAGTVAGSSVFEILGPFMDPENGRNIIDAVEAARRQGRGESMNVNTSRQLREIMAEMERMDSGR